MEQKTTAGIKPTKTMSGRKVMIFTVIQLNAALRVSSAVLKPGYELDTADAMRPVMNERKMICSISDVINGVMISVGTIPTIVSITEMLAPSAVATAPATAEASTADASTGFPIGKSVYESKPTQMAIREVKRYIPTISCLPTMIIHILIVHSTKSRLSRRPRIFVTTESS